MLGFQSYSVVEISETLIGLILTASPFPSFLFIENGDNSDTCAGAVGHHCSHNRFDSGSEVSRGAAGE